MLERQVVLESDAVAVADLMMLWSDDLHLVLNMAVSVLHCFFVRYRRYF